MVDICHIAAASQDGPRYDESQTDEERNGFDNLILLCPNHHRQIDGQPDVYPVETLKKMKKRAASADGGVSLTNEAAKELIAAMAEAGARSTVVSVGQVGGQTAQTIVNLGKPSRTISKSAKTRMRHALEPHAGASVGFASFAGDPEASAFKRQLMAAFDEAGWTVVDQSTFMFFGDRAGVVLTIPFGADDALPHIQAAAAALDETGQLLGGNRGDMANEAGIYVQIWPAP